MPWIAGGAINAETQARIIAVRDRVSQAAGDYDQRLAVLLAERDAIRAEAGAALTQAQRYADAQSVILPYALVAVVLVVLVILVFIRHVVATIIPTL